VTRLEDDRLLRGAGCYVDDLGEGALEVAFVRSPHAHARIVDIDVTDAALDVPGLVAIYTWGDLPAPTRQPLPVSLPHPGLHSPRTQHALARDEVNHVGEAVVMILARDRYAAEDACGAVEVTYEPLPAVVGVVAAERADHAVHPDVPDNIAGVVRQESGDVDAALAAAPHVLDVDLWVERSMASPLEGRGVYAHPDPAGGRLRLYTSTQVAHGVRAGVAHMLGRPAADLDVITPDVGGAFGVKGVRPWPEEVLVAWAADHLGVGVKWTEDRREHFVASAHERAQQQRVRVGFDEDGRLLGYDVEILHDVGAYTQYGLVVSQNTSSHLLGPYGVAAKRATVTALYTNAVMIAPFRGAGRPEAVYAVERTLDAVAAHLGLDRTLVRERNLIRPEQMPYGQGFFGQDGREVVYDSGDYPASMQKLKDLVGWDDFADYRGKAASAGRRVGIGMACYVENTGLGPYEGAHVVVEPSGIVRVATGLTTQGQGHFTAFAQVVSQELGVRLEDVVITTGDTRRVAHSAGTYASRGAVVGGTAIAMASRVVREKALRAAADALEADLADLEIADGVVRVAGNPDSGIPLGALAVLCNPLRYSFDAATRAALPLVTRPGLTVPGADGDEPGLSGTRYFSPPGSTYANGMHAVIVETDPETAEIKILRYCVVHDCGTVINPMIVEGQIHGGVAQGVGGALYERMEYDENGQLLNASFMDFLMPYSTEVPDTIEIDHLETPSPLNLLGIKGAGEAGVIPSAAAIASALEDAEGFAITRMPISPSELHALRREHLDQQVANVPATVGG
jgi:carbon-monoxide dehydrogenase large subunit